MPSHNWTIAYKIGL